MESPGVSSLKRNVQFVWWWDRWYSLPRFVRWEGGYGVFLDFSIIIGPLEIRVWKPGFPNYAAISKRRV